MNLQRKLKNQQNTDIVDLYALKIGSLWSALKAEHLSVWMLCIYFFFEYVKDPCIMTSGDKGWFMDFLLIFPPWIKMV